MARFISRPLMLALVLMAALFITACGGGVDVPKTADMAVLRVANGVAENKPVVIWDALPESYQKDVHELVHNLMGKVDGSFYNSIADTSKKLTKVLKEKKQFILAHPMVAQQMPNKAEVEKQWDQIVGILDSILSSDLGKYETAKTVNVGAFLDTTGSKIMADLTNAAKLASTGERRSEANEMLDMYEKLKKIKATMVKESGDTATVKVEMPGEETKETEFVRIEGKWLPKEMVDGWKEMMTEARKALSGIDAAELKKNTDQAFDIIGKVNGVLDQLDKAKTQEKFNAAINGLMALMQGGGAGPGPEGKGDDF